MLLNTDQDILDNYEKLITGAPTRENLEACGCILLKEYYSEKDDWVIIYKGERYEFTRLRQQVFDDILYTLKIYCKHYTNSEKTAWVGYGHEYAKNLKELFAWIDAEIEFYKDHPEEKQGTPEYERKQKRIGVISEEFDSLRWHFNLINRDYNLVGYGPEDNDDVVWYGLYAEACKIAEQKHPELFEK